jgi:hypothetical protein
MRSRNSLSLIGLGTALWSRRHHLVLTGRQVDTVGDALDRPLGGATPRWGQRRGCDPGRGSHEKMRVSQLVPNRDIVRHSIELAVMPNELS